MNFGAFHITTELWIAASVNYNVCLLTVVIEWHIKKFSPKTKINISGYLTYDYGNFPCFFSCSELVVRVFRQKKSKLWRVGGWKCQSKHSWLRKDYSLDLAWIFKPHRCLNTGNECWIDRESGPVKFTTCISADRAEKERARYTFTLWYKWLGKNGHHFWTYRFN